MYGYFIVWKKREEKSNWTESTGWNARKVYIYIIEAFISRCKPFSFEYEFLYQYKKGTILSYSFGSLLPSILMSMKMLGYKKY